MEINWLEDLIELDAARNFSAAAAARHISQPAFSRRIKSLENWVGAQLIDRSSYPVRLTQAGETVLEAARGLSQDMYRLRDECRELSHPSSDDLSISALHSIALGVFPSYSQRLQGEIGSFTTRMNATDYYDCLESLNAGRCELAVCYDQALGPRTLRSSQFQSVKIMEEPLILVAAAAQAQEMTARLNGEGTGKTLPLVAYTSGCFLGKIQEIMIKSYYDIGVGFHVAFENSMSEVLKRMILEGVGIGWIPKNCMSSELQDGRLVALSGPVASLDLDILLLRKEVQGSAILEKLWAHAQSA